MSSPEGETSDEIRAGLVNDSHLQVTTASAENDTSEEVNDDEEDLRVLSGSSTGTEIHSQVSSKTGWFASSLLIVNAALGAGLLNFPSAYHDAGGILTGTLVQLIMMLFILPALVILAYSSDLNQSKTLQEVLAFAWGTKAEKFTSSCIALYCFGTCITFLIIIGDQFDRVFASLYGQYFCHEWYMNRNFTVAVTSALFILPFCYAKTIDILKHISTVGVLSVIYVAILVIVQYYTGNYIAGDIKTSPTAWTDVFLVVPTICFGYQCHVSVIPIYSCFKRRNLSNYLASVILALAICVFTYTVAATFGYLTFGSKIDSDILKSYDASDPYILLAVIAISVKTYTTYPILSFCGNSAICDLWVNFHTLEERDAISFKENVRLTSITIWFIASLVLAIAMPNIGSVIQLLGSLAAVFIFIFPGLCLLRLALNQEARSKNKYFSLQIFSGFFLALGGFIFGCVFTQAIIVDFIQEKVPEIPLCVEQKSFTSKFAAWF